MSFLLVNIPYSYLISIDPLTTYIWGFTFIDENFLFLEFDEKEPEKPYFIVYSETNELLFKEGIKQADSCNKFSGIHYRTWTQRTHISNGEWIIYNPECVFKIQPVTLKERILFLYSKKRIDECIDLVNTYLISLPEDIILKVRNAKLNKMLQEKDFHGASFFLPKYWGKNADQWQHWIMRFKQNKSLGFITDFIPVGDPVKLLCDTYWKILKELLKQKDFGNLVLCVERFKPHLLDYKDIAEEMYQMYGENNELIKNSLFFKSLLKVAEYTDNKLGLFLMFLKSKNIHAFDILQDPGTSQIKHFYSCENRFWIW